MSSSVLGTGGTSMNKGHGLCLLQTYDLALTVKSIKNQMLHRRIERTLNVHFNNKKGFSLEKTSKGRLEGWA